MTVCCGLSVWEGLAADDGSRPIEERLCPLVDEDQADAEYSCRGREPNMVTTG